MPITRFSLLVNNLSYGLPSDQLFNRVVQVAEAAEATAFDTLWLPDHLIQGPVGDVGANRGDTELTPEGPNGRMTPIFDAPTLLCALAVTTKRLRIGPLVSPITIRHPPVLAKSMTTIDVVSGGRAVLGIGAAWDADEHRRYGFAFPSPAERLDRLEESVQICRGMFDEIAASHTGKYYTTDEAINIPRPVSRHIPILVGGNGSRTLRIAATYADACNPIGDEHLIRSAQAMVDKHCRDIGRDPTQVSRPGGVMFHRLQDLFGQVERAFQAGCDGVILIPWQLALSADDITAIGNGLAYEFGLA